MQWGRVGPQNSANLVVFTLQAVKTVCELPGITDYYELRDVLVIIIAVDQHSTPTVPLSCHLLCLSVFWGQAIQTKGTGCRT